MATLVRVGGRTIKNKSGFDLVGIFVGSEACSHCDGNHSAPDSRTAARAALAGSFANASVAAACVQHLFREGFLPSALELADQFTLQAARRHLGSEHLPKGNAHLLIEIDGQPGSVRSEVAHPRRLAQVRRGLGNHHRDNRSRLRTALGFASRILRFAQSDGLTKLNEDICVPRSKLVDLFAYHRGACKKNTGSQIASCSATLATAIFHVNIMSI